MITDLKNKAHVWEGEEPKWLTIARKELGVHEVKGSTDNPRIVEYHSTTGLSANDDETPWCASFVGWCLQQAGIEPTHSAAAKSYATWGVESPMVYGAIAVLTRIGGNHVAFIVGWNETHVQLLGGNQGDAVSIKDYDRSRIQTIRMPKV